MSASVPGVRGGAPRLGRSRRAPVDLVGWSLGGVLSLLTAAADAALPIRSVTAVGTPLDYNRVNGSHLGILIARDTTWSYLEKFLGDQA